MFTPFVNMLTNESVASTLLIYSLIIALGMTLGKVKVKGVSLGVACVLFVGLLAGHLGLEVNASVLDFVKNFGLIIFIFTIGLQVGPGFFSSFKKGGMVLNGLAVLTIVLGMGLTIALYFIFRSHISLPMMVGVMSGAVTSTPGLGAAQEALQQLNESGMIEEVPPISLGYAVGYPVAILTLILVMICSRYLFCVDIKKEESMLGMQNDADVPDILTLKVSNQEIEGLTIMDLKHRFQHQFIATRVFDGEKVFIPKASTPLHVGNIVLIVTRDQNAEALSQLLGEQTSYEWKDDDKDLVSRRIVVTRNGVNGKTIGELHLRSDFNVNITRINRAGINLLARPDLVLQVGDRVMVVGPKDGIEHAEHLLGNTLKKLNEPHLVTIFVGIIVGILIGLIPIRFPNMPMPARLGLAGGPLIVAILIGRFGYKLKLISYTTQSANLMLRELGICLFLASVGLSSGGRFAETVLSPDGAIFALCAFLIAALPALIVGIIARCMKMNFFTILGLMAGGVNSIPPLAYASSLSDVDEPAVVYSTVYPLVCFLRIVVAQWLILAFV